MYLKPVYSPTGSLSVVVLADASLRIGDGDVVNDRNASVGSIEQSSYERLSIRDQAVFDAGDEGTWKAAFGDVSAQSAQPAPRLAVGTIRVRSAHDPSGPRH